MLNTKTRHLKHLLKFDYDEEKEKNKKDSDYILDTLNINKNEFFFISRKGRAFLIGNNFHENDIYKSIKVVKTSYFIIIYFNCYFLKAGFDSDFEQLLLDGKKSFEDCNPILLDKEVNSSKPSESIKIQKTENILGEIPLLTRDLLLENISKYNIDDRLTDKIIEKELTLNKFFENEIFAYERIMLMSRTQEIDALFSKKGYNK